MCWRMTLMPSCLLPATSRLKVSHQPHSPPKQAKSGFSSTQEESIPGPQLTSTVNQASTLPPIQASTPPPIQASTPPPTSIDLNQLSTPSPSTPDLYNPEAGLDLIKKEPSYPSEKPCSTPQSRTVDPKSLWRKFETLRLRGGWSVFCAEKIVEIVEVHLNGEGWEANNWGIHYSPKKVHGKKWEFSQ